MTEELATVLRDHGHRVTRPRLATWQALASARRHLTAEELAAEVQRREPGVNLASVYRSLALFDELGLVRESHLGDGDASRWEIAHPDEHFHVVCRSCGSIDHHVGSLVETIRDHLRDGHGFHPTDIDLTVSGTCAECAGAA